MKTKFNYLLIACLATTLSIGDTFGQGLIKKSSTATRFEYGDNLANPTDASLSESRVSQRALNAFSKKFPDASQVKWSRVGNKYGISFMDDDKQHRCLYNVKGNLIYTLRYGSEKDLPRDIRKDIKREYVDYDITQAVETHEDNRNVWIVNLDDDNTLVTVAIENGSMEELNHYKKSKSL